MFCRSGDECSIIGKYPGGERSWVDTLISKPTWRYLFFVWGKTLILFADMWNKPETILNSRVLVRD